MQIFALCEVFDFGNGDEKELLDFYKTENSRSKSSQKEYFDWYFNQNPAGQGFLPIIRDQKTNIIIGSCWVVPIRFRIFEQDVVGGVVLNLLVHPEFRRQGVYSEIKRAYMAIAPQYGMQFLTGLPNFRWIERKGANDRRSMVETHRIVIRPLKKFFPSKRNSRNNSLPLDALPLTASDENVVIKQIDAFGDEFDTFWRDECNKYEYSVIRDRCYLSWRYLSNPMTHYQIFAAYQGECLLGFAVGANMNIRVPGRNRWVYTGVIQDFFVQDSPLGTKAGNLLISSLRKKLGDEDVGFLVSISHNQHQEGKILKEQRFLKFSWALNAIDIKIPFTNLSHFEIHDHAKKNWYYQLGDFDIV